MQNKAKVDSKKPIEIKRGNVAVKIYKGENRVKGTSYVQFTVIYYSGSQRMKRRFANLDEAKREAELIAIKLANGENEVLRMTSTDRAIYIQAIEQLKPFNVPLNVAIGEYVHVLKQLPIGISLRETVDFFIRRNPAGMPQKTVREVVDELIESKTKGGRGEVHLKDLTGRLGRFADAMQLNISQVTGRMIEQYLINLNVAGRTQKNHLRIITSLFKFATRRRYLSKDALDELEAVEKPDEKPTAIEIFSPSEIYEMLSVARPEIIPWLSIAAFAGLRNAELQRLDWTDIDLAERHIEVPAAKSKTASRRIVPITDNLFAWLAPHSRQDGRLTGFENMAKQIAWLVRDVNDARKRQEPNVANFKWKRNGLRHSFVSYRIAAIKDAAQVALEAGNSPGMIFKHYRALVTEAEALKWFSIMPSKESNVIPMLKDAVLA